MISKVIVIIIHASVTLCQWFLVPICATNPLQTAKENKYFAHKTMESVPNEMSNTLEHSSSASKNTTFINYQQPHSVATTASNRSSLKLLESVISEYKIASSKVRDHPTINETTEFSKRSHQLNNRNQGNNVNYVPKYETRLLSDIKLVNSSASVPPLLSLPPRSTAPGTDSTNSTLTVSSHFERVEMHEALTPRKNEKFLLHRNKRYLLFPGGSSFQLVFDLIIPIVDYTNFAIMGITCAVAWELPSKPPSQIIENFRTKLNDGKFGHNRRNDPIHQPLEYTNSQRMDEADKTRWREGVALYRLEHPSHYQQHQQLPPTTAATSGHKHFLTNTSKSTLLPPTNSYYYYNNHIQEERMQQPIPTTTTTTFFYGPNRQKQQWTKNNFDTIDFTQRKIVHANSNNEGVKFKNDFNSYKPQQIYDKELYPSKNRNFESWQQQNQQQRPKMKQHYSEVGDYWNKENWWRRNKKRIEHWREKKPKWSKYQSIPPMFSRRTSRNRKILNKPPKHYIYPIFGKRRRRHSSTGHFQSNNDDATLKLQAIHSREHLQTRQKLYGKIEKLYKTRGQNGTACVLRALCETERMNLNAQRNNEMPQSFVMELLRSMFALPTATLANLKDSLLHLDDRYAIAVLLAHDVTKSCVEQYDNCEYSIAYET